MSSISPFVCNPFVCPPSFGPQWMPRRHVARTSNGGFLPELARNRFSRAFFGHFPPPLGKYDLLMDVYRSHQAGDKRRKNRVFRFFGGEVHSKRMEGQNSALIGLWRTEMRPLATNPATALHLPAFHLSALHVSVRCLRIIVHPIRGNTTALFLIPVIIHKYLFLSRGAGRFFSRRTSRAQLRLCGRKICVSTRGTGKWEGKRWKSAADSSLAASSSHFSLPPCTKRDFSVARSP